MSDNVVVPKKAVDALLALFPDLCEQVGLCVVANKQYPHDMHGKPVTAPIVYFNMDMSTAPKGGKLIALNPGRVATFAVLNESNKQHFIGWSPMPKIPKDKP